MLPIGRTLQKVLQGWLDAGRPFLAASGETALFVNRHGRRLGPWGISYLLRTRSGQAGLKDVTPHALRRTFATHLVEHGADVRHVQELLGHRHVATTRYYVRIECGRAAP